MYIFVGYIAAYMIYSGNLSRVEILNPDWFFVYYTYLDADQMKYPRSEFTFNSGKNTLTGYEYGEENNRGLIVISSGLGGTGDYYMEFITRFLDDGYRVITYDNTGVARSEGSGTRGLYQSAIDIDALLTYIETQSKYDNLPVYLIGHSWGGYGVCAALAHNNHDSVK